MLGTQDDIAQSPEQLVPWWQLKPKQSAPPRQTLMHPPGQVARFVADQAIYSTKVRSGRSTAVGGDLDIPQVDPYFCYVVVAMQLAVYAAGTWLAVTRGPEAAEQWAVALSLQPHEVLSQEADWRLATSLLLHGGIAHLTVDTAFLGWFGPGIEALLGHGVFLYIYLLSGLAGSAAVMLFTDGDAPTACATAASVGLVGAMVGYELRNQEIVKQSIKSRHSKAEDGKQGNSTLRKPFGAFGVVCLMLALGFIPGSMVDNTAHVGGLLAGVGLGYTLGPSFTIIQEVDIPEGSMMVPEDAVETVVVLDRRSSLDRIAMGAAALGMLAAVVVFGTSYAQ
jgi:rhomboid protease GluP